MVSITVTVELPKDVEERLRSEKLDLVNDVREAYALNLFRREQITHAQLGRLLGLDRFEIDAFLKRNHVLAQSLTDEDIVHDRNTLDQLFASNGR